MNFLLDENQSPLLVGLLASLGHNVVHVGDLGLASAADVDVLAVASEQGRVLISADTDFGELLAESNASGPSVVLFRRQGQRRVAELVKLLSANLGAIAEDLETGALVVIDADRIRVRRLPMNPD